MGVEGLGERGEGGIGKVGVRALCFRHTETAPHQVSKTREAFSATSVTLSPGRRRRRRSRGRGAQVGENERTSVAQVSGGRFFCLLHGI